MSEYIWKDPFKRPLRVVTCCPVGICTCILTKIAVEKVFDQLGITSEITPTTEGNPMGGVNGTPDILITEGMQLEALKEKVPAPIALRIHDLGKPDEIKAEIIKHLLGVGWLEEA